MDTEDMTDSRGTYAALLKTLPQGKLQVEDVQQCMKDMNRDVLEERFSSIKNETVKKLAIETCLLLGESATSTIKRNQGKLAVSKRQDNDLLRKQEKTLGKISRECMFEREKLDDLILLSDRYDDTIVYCKKELAELGSLIDAKRKKQPYTGSTDMLKSETLNADISTLLRYRGKVAHRLADMQYDLGHLHAELKSQHIKLVQYEELRKVNERAIANIHEGQLKKAEQATQFTLPEFIEVIKTNLEVMVKAEADVELYDKNKRMSAVILDHLGRNPVQNPYQGKFLQKPTLGNAVFGDDDALSTTVLYDALSREAAAIKELYR
ncbi:MAG: hypothetical protein V1725_07615 [archaeon]